MIADLIKAGDREAALRWCDAAWEEDPDSAEAAFYFATLMAENGHPGIAKFVYEVLSERHPDKWQALQNLGYTLVGLGLEQRAIKALQKARKKAGDTHAILVGLSSCYTIRHDWMKAEEYAERALAMEDSIQARTNLAFCHLAQGRYGDGWDHYVAGVGHQKWRDRHEYGLEEGIGDRTVIYAEQGIGDQIAFCSALRDGIRDDKVHTLNCHPKLRNLFADSFPGIAVHGDQFNSKVGWTAGATHQAPMSALMQKYRRKPEDFPRTPFLKANPDKARQWRVLLEGYPRPWYGIAWTGGYRGSHSWERKELGRDILARILEVDATWICLEYNDKGERPPGIVEWPWATITSDYSDTAALVCNLDAVVGAPTSVHHLAGGLGVDSYCLVHERPHFHYSAGMPYYGTVQLYQRTPDDQARMLEELHAAYRGPRAEPSRAEARGGDRQRGNGAAQAVPAAAGAP